MPRTFDPALYSMQGNRPQTILTPDSIIDRVLALWPEGIEYDPCAGPEYEGPPARRQSNGFEEDGLQVDWPDRTYCNPPYNQLRAWLAKSYSTDTEHLMLVPVRPHRAWYQLAQYDAVAMLAPLKFRGYDGAFPTPLCVLYKTPDKSRLPEFARIFRDLSRSVISCTDVPIK